VIWFNANPGGREKAGDFRRIGLESRRGAGARNEQPPERSNAASRRFSEYGFADPHPLLKSATRDSI
jgi:hypothetical protein